MKNSISKTGRGVVAGKGLPLAVLMAGLKSDRVTWVEKDGSLLTLKIGRFVGLNAKTGRATVKDPAHVDRSVFIPLSGLAGGHVLVRG